MIPSSQAYSRFKEQGVAYLTFAALVCVAVPFTKNEAAKLDDSTRFTPDVFSSVFSAANVATMANDYQAQLAATTVITLYSYFEAFVSDLLREIVDFHGGPKALLALAERRARPFLKADEKTTKLKRKLQEYADKRKFDKYKRNSRLLSASGFRFPTELLAVYGVKKLIEAAKPRGMKAFEIPYVLQDALVFALTEADQKQLDAIRELRNNIAHGARKPLNLRAAINMGTRLRDLAVRIDEHAREHFLLLEQFV